MSKVEEWAMCALGSLVVTGFFAISVTFFVGSLLVCGTVMKVTWDFFTQ
jgi:hypothetical protein